MMSFADWTARATPLETGGLRVATHDDGPQDAPVVTYLHGFPASSLDIVPTAERIGDERRILTLDFPGFGASEKPTGHRYSIHACADSVEDLWAFHGVTGSVLVADDYGVSVAQELLARRLDGRLEVEVGGTVWSNGGLYPDLHRPTDGQKMLLDPENGPALAAAVDEGLFRSGIAVTWGQRVPMTDEEIHEMWVSMAHEGGTALMHDLLGYIADRREHAERWRNALETYDGPMRFVWGDLDPVSGAHMIERVEERIPAAGVNRMADVGHWPPLESPDELASAILDL